MLNYVLQQLKVLKLTKFQKHASNNTYVHQNLQNMWKFDVDGQVKVGMFLKLS